ncbi:MAG: hypothetical protein ACI9YE_000284 [Psychroserpens sp.]|jgi:hypothetical protein
MTEKYIDFKFNRVSENVDIDLNDPRVTQHLKALIRGMGSSTENIVLDFVNNTTSTIKKYGSVQHAWSILDEGQKIIIDGFRSLTSKGDIQACENCFCHYWYCNVVADRYFDLIIEYEREIDAEVEDIEIKVRLAKQAEKEIKLQLTSTNDDPVWTVEVDEC